MNVVKRTALDLDTSLAWSRKVQGLLLQGLMESHQWTTNDLVFHGGTSLHLSWNSPRFSEDLDFLLNRNIQSISSIMEKVEKNLKETMVKEDPNFEIHIFNKTKDNERMPVFHVKVGHKNYVGKTLVKVEFWMVQEEYLSKYPSQLRTPKSSDMVMGVYPVQAADLETAFCDKLTAFSTRPYLKWRDIYDIWWIGTQSEAELNVEQIVSQFKHNLSGYNLPPDLSVAEALARFLNRDTEELVALADPDLKKWLTPVDWNIMKGQGVRDMVLYTKHILEQITLALENGPAQPTLPKRYKR